MSLVAQLKDSTAKAIQELYHVPLVADNIVMNQTKPEFEGQYTIVLFSFVKQLRKSPEALGHEIGTHLTATYPQLVTGYNVIKGFLNLLIADAYFIQALADDKKIDTTTAPAKKVIVEYSSPNTNKPLHLGHLRNNFLGWSVAQILKATGNHVLKTCIVNDRGVHICKSMIAWQQFAEGATPETTGIKGDHFVGDYYVKSESVIKSEAAALQAAVEAGDFSGISDAAKEKLVALQQQINTITGDSDKEKERRKKLEDDRKELLRANTSIMQQTQQMLVDWESGKSDVLELWRKMNGWVYKGFDETYRRIGSDFDKIYYESETYLLGKEFVEKGLSKGILYKKDDGSVWIDLTAEGLDEKLVLRKDGTSVYITQDLGLAQKKYEEFQYDQSIYLIADEQNYHMKVLKLILQKLGMPYADGIFHLSYGMVELPTGRMKSREGTVVDADDIVEEMVKEAEKKTAEHSKIEEFSGRELLELYEMIGLGALKFFLLRVDPKKKMIFNPEESIEFHGFTGPFIQYTHARIKSILRKEQPALTFHITTPLLPLEKELLVLLEQYTDTVQNAALTYDPSLIANYIFSVAQTYNSFYVAHSVMKAETEEKKQLRLRICRLTADVIAHAMSLLGIKVPERM